MTNVDSTANSNQKLYDWGKQTKEARRGGRGGERDDRKVR